VNWETDLHLWPKRQTFALHTLSVSEGRSGQRKVLEKLSRICGGRDLALNCFSLIFAIKKKKKYSVRKKREEKRKKPEAVQ
jgi:hypothetical protein